MQVLYLVSINTLLLVVLYSVLKKEFRKQFGNVTFDEHVAKINNLVRGIISNYKQSPLDHKSEVLLTDLHKRAGWNYAFELLWEPQLFDNQITATFTYLLREPHICVADVNRVGTLFPMPKTLFTPTLLSLSFFMCFMYENRLPSLVYFVLVLIFDIRLC